MMLYLEISTATIPAMLEISVQLNTSITNSSDDGDIDIRGAGDPPRTYSSSAIDLTGGELDAGRRGHGHCWSRYR